MTLGILRGSGHFQPINLQYSWTVKSFVTSGAFDNWFLKPKYSLGAQYINPIIKKVFKRPHAWCVPKRTNCHCTLKTEVADPLLIWEFQSLSRAKLSRSLSLETNILLPSRWFCVGIDAWTLVSVSAALPFWYFPLRRYEQSGLACFRQCIAASPHWVLRFIVLFHHRLKYYWQGNW